MAAAAFTMLIPRPGSISAGHVIPHYVSAGTQSVKINDAAFNTSASSSNCASTSSGLQCTFAIDLPVGSGIPLTIETYDQPLTASGSVQGNVLSSATTYANVVAGQANVIKVTLAGNPAKATLTISNPTPTIGIAASIPMTVTAYDADGYAIAGSYSPQIQLDAGTAYSLGFSINGTSGTDLQSSSDTVAIAYSGHGTTGTTISAKGQSGVISNASFTPQPGFGTEIPVGTSLVGASATQDTSSGTQTIWFTEPAKHAIASYTPGAAIAEYSTTSNQPLYRIAANPAQMYATEPNGIAYVSLMFLPPGFFEHTAPTSNAGVYEIGGFDASLAVYFSEKNVGKIGKFSGGTVTEFSTGNPSSTPAGMAYCDGSSWWFADPGANAIGRITNSGATTYYPVPTAGAQPTEISADHSGSTGLWWFTEPGANKVGTIDATGTIIEYPSAGKPVGIDLEQYDAFVLTDSGQIEVYDPATGKLRNTYTPPPSPAGPVVGIFSGTYGSVILLRSDGTNGSIQTFNYE